jgi:hypothetical protein
VTKYFTATFSDPTDPALLAVVEATECAVLPTPHELVLARGVRALLAQLTQCRRDIYELRVDRESLMLQLSLRVAAVVHLSAELHRACELGRSALQYTALEHCEQYDSDSDEYRDSYSTVDRAIISDIARQLQAIQHALEPERFQ